jgi:phosphopantothenate-cysteine ligase
VDTQAGYAAALAALGALRFEEVSGTLHRYEIRTVEDLMARMHDLLSAGDKTVVIHAMAVSDYTAPAQQGKISSDKDELIVRLERAPKVIAHLKTWAPRIVQVGFKLLSGVSREELYAAGLASGRAYRSDLTIANDQRQIASGAHPALAIWPDGRSAYIARDLATRVVDLVEEALARRVAADARAPWDDGAAERRRATRTAESTREKQDNGPS